MDAVRREAQAAAYLAFTTAAALERGANNLVDMKVLRDACRAVEVQGPTHLVALARDVVASAAFYNYMTGSVFLWWPPNLLTTSLSYRLILRRSFFRDRRASRDALVAAVEEFKTAARDHLNDSGG